jgi:hypothetical protein
MVHHPKGPDTCAELTARVVAGSQQDATGGFAFADDMAGGGRREDAILTDQQLLDAVGRANLGNQLNDLGVPESAITTNDEKGSFLAQIW